MADLTADEEEAPPAEAPEGLIGPIPDRGQAREWALVLQSQSIGFLLYPQDPGERGVPAGESGWMLRVQPRDYDRALGAIDLYETENENWPPPRVRDRPRHQTSLIVPLAFALLALFFFHVTGPSIGGSRWFIEGRADSLRLAIEPWRMITALCLHADAPHVLGNMLSGGIFGAMVSRRIGPGGALLSIIVAGAFGNTLNALYHLPEQHRSIGASTAVFAAVGILAALQTTIDWHARRKKKARYRWVDIVAPAVGGLTLLGTLGAGKGNTDVWAHAYGFLAGVLVGLSMALFMTLFMKPEGKASAPVQVAALIGAICLVGGSWALALGT